MDEARRALLIGVGQAPATADVWEPLGEAVEADLRLMSTALQASGYEVESLHDAGLSLIRSTIYETARDTPAGATLLLYFTGHGLRVNGTDYLVPADAVPPSDGNWREPYLDSLLPANIGPLLKDCPAGTVLWLIDACRTDTASDGELFGTSVDCGPPQGGFAVLTGCSAGERCGYTADGSFFTRGLADALGPLTPSRKVHAVFATALARTREAAVRHGMVQRPRIRYGTDAESETKESEICGGRPLLEAWLEAALSTSLWERVPATDQAQVPAFQDALGVFVERCAHTVHLAQQRLPHPDPWVDDAFLFRLLSNRLPLLLPKDTSLSAIEVVALIAAPFLHEVAWAERLSQAAETDPYALERRTEAQAHRRHYEQIVEQHGRIARKLTDCRARGRVEDAASVAMWLVHRWIADRFQTDDEVVPAKAAEALAEQLGVADGRVHELSQLLRVAASGLSREEPFDEPNGWASRKVLLPGGHQQLRIRPLAALLRLAATLAVDVRALPDVVAEHLAVSDPVLPQQIVAMARGLSWHREGNALHLDAPCPHQAVHAALTELAHEADQLSAQTWELAGDLRESEVELLAAVPGRITDRDLRPLRVGPRAAYEVPLLRFHLAQTEVRDLLMGKQLYGGEPQLALRELYQNAMDACRYRAMRWDFLQRIGARPADWTGRISFTQGEDERGRYVECRDNGVGMSAEQLKQTFTRAGSRFERSTAFRKEQSRWLRHDPALRLYPNSRFGIGVFSYFMLADEMTIVTRQVNAEGIPAEHALRVEIPSSGSLFRIQRHDGSDDGLAEGGTRVRLYLREGTTGRPLSCVSVLRHLVRVSEFVLEAREATGHEHVWEPGVLQQLPGAESIEWLEAVPGALWWVTGEGALLCDGIVTDKKPFGYVVNLTGPHAGKLSVSRKELQEFDAEWVEELWRRGATELAVWRGLSLRWLGQLDEKSNRAARVLDRHWQGQGVLASGWEEEAVDLDQVGWFHLDRGVVLERLSSAQRACDPWRARVLRIAYRKSSVAVPSSLVGHPVAAAGDAAIVTSAPSSWCQVVGFAANHGMTVEELLRRCRALRIVHPAYAPLPSHGGFLDLVPDAVDGALANLLHGESEIVSAGDGSEHWGALILASDHLSTPLGDLVRRLRKFAPLLPSPLPDVPPEYEHHVCTRDDLEGMFIQSSDGRSVLWTLANDPLDIRTLSERTGLPQSEVLRRLSAFSWLGWTVPSPQEVSAWAALPAQTYEVVRLFSTQLPDGVRMLHWAATVDFADTLETNLRDAEERLARDAERLGLRYERRYTHDRTTGDLTPSSDAAILTRRLVELKRTLEQGVDTESFALACLAYSSEIDMNLAADDLAQAGVPIPDNLTVVSEWAKLPLRARYVLSGKEASYEEEDYPTGRMTAASLFSSAELLNETLRDVWALAAQYAERYGLTMPVLPDSLAEFRPTGSVCSAVVSHPSVIGGYFGPATWHRLSPLRLATYAHHLAVDPATAYERLLPLRSLDALIPELPARSLAALRSHIPDACDLLALHASHRVTKDGASYVPLDLVSIAGRLGEPIPRTVDRIAPYLPLCPAGTVLPSVVPDIIPLWQDLTLLTQFFDGLLPAVEGRVTSRHIRRAAEATGESEEWIAHRLRLYAEMFELTVKEGGCATDE
ncbi:caspase family protein [Streptomyces sp. NPDC000070]|uniref:HD domain-containing protein n=1 Tax=Streptomyces sp. NPDC000070 TaxID=3154240 RepID=UPI00332DD0D4